VEALVVWKSLEGKRKECNAEIQRAHQEAVIEWEKEWDTAKAEKKWSRWAKLKQQKLEAAIPRLKKVDLVDTKEEEEDIKGKLNDEVDFDIDQINTIVP
jgi:hypothetical protein